MDKLTTDFLSFFVHYMGSVSIVAALISVPLSVHHIIAVRSYYREREERLMDELSKALRSRRKAERDAEFQRTTKTADIERLTKKVADLEGELSAIRANSSKQK